MNNEDDEKRIESINNLVTDCIFSNNIEILCQLIFRLEKEYQEIAYVSTFGEYTTEWTHHKTLNYITYET